MVVVTSYQSVSTTCERSTELRMAATYYDILEKLEQLDEITLLEILDITSQDIVAKFSNRINDRLSEFQEDFKDEH